MSTGPTTNPKAEAPSTERARPSSFKIGAFLRPYRLRVGIVASLLVLNAALGLVNPWLVQALIDRVIVARRPDLLWMIAGSFLGLALVRFAMSLLQGQVYTALAARVLLDLRARFLERLQGLSLRFFAGARYGELVVRFNRDLSTVQEFATASLPSLVTSILTVLGVAALGLAYDWKLFLIAASPFPLALLSARAFRGRVESLTRTLRGQSSDLATGVNETLTGQRAVRSFGREKRELRRLVERGHALLRTSLRFQWTNSWANGLPRLCLVISTVIVWALGGRLVIRGEMALGELIALSMYVGLVFAPLMSLIDFYLELVQVRVSLERVRELGDQRPEVEEPATAPLPATIRGAIAFEDVRFRYQPGVPLLEGASFRIEPGETVALTGASGTGKSTIVDLLFRFLDPQSGRVTIDGQDLRSVRTSVLRRSMAVVSQDVFLFHDTVRANVRYGRAGASDDEVRAACKSAGVDTMLPPESAGLETIVGERGAQLSGGERQRIAIARALLRDPRILVLDEATASLDRQADRGLHEALERLSQGRTTLLITHHENRIAHVRRVLVLTAGGVVEELEVDTRAAKL